MWRSIFPVIAFALLAGGCAHHDAARPSSRAVKRTHERKAREAAIEWLELVDKGDYEEALDREPARIRAAVTLRQFERSMEARRAPFGHAISRTLVGSESSRRLSGAPDANYESLLFKTAFEHKAAAAERVILAEEHGRWRVVDYRVY
jgi:hypothetical protein